MSFHALVSHVLLGAIMFLLAFSKTLKYSGVKLVIDQLSMQLALLLQVTMQQFSLCSEFPYKIIFIANAL